MRLKDKIAIVTGAGSGIGRATAIRFAQEGAKVVVDDVNEAGGQQTVETIKAAGGEATFIRADVSNASDVERLFAATRATYGNVNVLVNCAICSAQEVEQNCWEPNVNVGLRGTWQCMQAAIPQMKEAGGGSIINISSVNALMGFANEHVYSGVKAGIIGMSRSLAGEVGKFGIRINCICPGTIVTEIWNHIIARDPGVLDRLVKLYPLGRLGKPEDIAHAALFFASDESSFATGSVLVVDGGITAAHMGFQI
jgi:NAD(P)-dependent dehydrogenase (short-subunit alcohol dehydrogenase family)